jgi:hypothetical protein
MESSPTSWLKLLLKWKLISDCQMEALRRELAAKEKQLRSSVSRPADSCEEDPTGYLHTDNNKDGLGECNAAKTSCSTMVEQGEIPGTIAKTTLGFGG